MTKPKPDHTSALRARARETDERVAEVLEAMADGTWEPGKSHRALMAKHGVAWETVRDWAVQAGRMHRILMGVDRDELRARNQARLDRVYAMALERQTVIPQKNADPLVIPQPDLKAAVAAVAEQGKLLGLNAPEKVQVSAGGDYDALTDEAKLAWVDERIAELQDERVRLVARMRIVEVK